MSIAAKKGQNVGFLKNRKLVVTYKVEQSKRKKMPGGGPQGTILGMFLFLLMINDAGFETKKNEIITITSAVNKRKEMETNHWKYVDDLTIAEALLLKETLVEDEEKKLIRQLAYYNRFQLLLPEAASKVQKQLEKLEIHALENNMKINKTKTKAMLFNTARKKDFTTYLKIDNETVELVEEMKLLGVHHPGQRCISYSNALQVSSLDRLDTRREAVCLKFARTLTRNQKFFNWFVEDSKIIET